MANRMRFDGGPAVPQRSPIGADLSSIRILRDVSGLIDLIKFGRIFGDEAVRLDEIGKDIIPRAMTADTPFDINAILFEPAGAAHQPVDAGQFVGDVIERRPLGGRSRCCGGRSSSAKIPSSASCRSA